MGPALTVQIHVVEGQGGVFQRRFKTIETFDQLEYAVSFVSARESLRGLDKHSLR